ncbi:MAG TPA: hypothetical protein DDY37_03100 [Legionella sp.]|nr:hypothetical protein [Legionella sp.]
MLNLKKTAVAVLALSSSAVFAGSMGPVCSAVNVTVPCEATAWDFGAKALYLKPSVNNGNGFNPIVSDTRFDHAPNYNWGFQIEGSYHFNTGNDLNLNWYHVSKSNSRTFGAQPLTSFNFGGGVTETAAFAGGNVSVDPKWDAVNIEVGQHVDFGDNKAIRFHGGAQYARLANNVTKSSGTFFGGSAAPVSGSYTHTTTYNPTYNGFGPRLGMDMSYDWGNGLGIYANGATGILAGTRSFSASYSDSLGNSIGGNGSQTVIVPVVDAKLGATYTYAMAQGDLTLDAGWMWVNYFNVHANQEGVNSDFGLQGPFIGLKWLGNVA